MRGDPGTVDKGSIGAVFIGDGPLPITKRDECVLSADATAGSTEWCQIDIGEDAVSGVAAPNQQVRLVRRQSDGRSPLHEQSISLDDNWPGHGIKGLP